MEDRRKWDHLKPTISIPILCVVLTASLGVIAWGIKDRIETEGRFEQIEEMGKQNTEAIMELSRRFEDLPNQEVTRREHQDLQDLIKATFDSLSKDFESARDAQDRLARNQARLEQKVDEFILMFAKPRSSQPEFSQPAPAGVALENRP
jgi:hypothetical protein